MRRVGKWGKINQKALKINRKKYEERGISTCEVNLLGICDGLFPGIAHRHNRVWYRRFENPLEMLTDDKQTLCSCNKCHTYMDQNLEERERIFTELRGPE